MGDSLSQCEQPECFIFWGRSHCRSSSGAVDQVRGRQGVGGTLGWWGTPRLKKKSLPTVSPRLPKTEAGNDPHACHSVYEPLRQSMNENEVYAALQAQESKLRLIHQTVFSLSDCVPLPCWSSSQNAGIPAGLCHGGARQVTNQHNMVDFFFPRLYRKH